MPAAIAGVIRSVLWMRAKFSGNLFHNRFRVFVLTEAHEADVAQVIAGRPLQEAELRSDLRPKPDAALHSGSREALTQASGARLGKVPEGTRRCFERSER